MVQQKLVGTGGSSGVGEQGMDFNTQLTNNILKLASGEVGKDIAATRSKQYIAGQARIAQGESLAEVRGSQGLFDQIFGQATVDGARAETVVQGADMHVRDMTLNMGQLRQMGTEEFIATQNDYVVDNLLTGDSGLDDYITLAASESINKIVPIHAKEHASYVQEINKEAYDNTVRSSSEMLDAIVKNPNTSIPDVVKAFITYAERIAQRPGQTAAAYSNSVVENIVADLDADRPYMYENFIQGGVTLKGEFVQGVHQMQFPPDKMKEIATALTKYQERNDVARKMGDVSTHHDLQVMSKDPSTTDAILNIAVEGALTARGADFMTREQVLALYGNVAASTLQGSKDADTMRRYASAKHLEFTDARAVDDAAILVWSKQMQDAESIQDPTAREQAVANVIQNNIKLQRLHRRVNPAWSAKFNSGMGQLQDPVVFANAMQLYNAGALENEDLMQSGMDEVSINNMVGVRELIQGNPGITIDSALKIVEGRKMPIQEAKAMLTDAGYKARIRDAVDSIMHEPVQGGLAGMFNLGEAENRFEIKQALEHYIARGISITGETDIPTSVRTGTALYRKSHELIGGRMVNNYGRNLHTAMQLGATDISADDAYNWYINTVLPSEQGMGEDFDPQKMVVRNSVNGIEFTPQHDDGTVVINLVNSGTKVSYQDIGAAYNREVLGPIQVEAILAGEARRNSDWSKMKRGLNDITNLTSVDEFANSDTIAHVKGGPVDGGINDKQIYSALQDPKTGRQLKSLMQVAGTQYTNGNTAGLFKTIEAISKVSGYVSGVTPDVVADIVGTLDLSSQQSEVQKNIADLIKKVNAVE